MLRPEITAERLHQGQVDSLPGGFGLLVTRIEATVFGPGDRKLALFRCTQMILS